MSCPDCHGTGFVYKTVDYKSRRTGRIYPDVKIAARCPLYSDYFKNVTDLLNQDVIFDDRGCSAASDQHERIKDQARAKKGGKGKKFI